MNFLSHSGQTNGFSPLWILRCTIKLQTCLNFLSQSGQTNSFSSVWSFRCIFNSLLRLNFLSQSEHTNGLSPVWILRWAFNLLLSLNFLSQSGQANGFFTGVNSTMHNQIAFFIEFLVTIRTDERLFNSVDQSKHIQFSWHNITQQRWAASTYLYIKNIFTIDYYNCRARWELKMSSPYALMANNNFSRTEYIHSCVDLKLSLLSIGSDTHLI